MKKIITAVLTFLLLLPASIALADENTVLMFIRDNSRDLRLMLEEEVLLMKDMLEAQGYQVEIATIDGNDLSADGVTVAVDHKITEVSMDDFGAIALPCMAPAPVEDVVVDLVRAANEAGKPIAASRGAVAYVAEAGALEGRRYAYASAVNVEERPSFRGGTFMGTGTERDGLVSTNGICPLASRSLSLPDGTKDLTQSLIDSLQSRS